MVLSHIPAEINETLGDIDGYLGFGLITYNGIPKFIEMSKKLSVKEEKVFSTMCATIMGASDVLRDVISPINKKMLCLCLHFEDYQILLAECKKKNVFIFLALEKQEDMQKMKEVLDKLIECVNEAKLML